MNGEERISLEKYIDMRISGIDRNICDLRSYIEQHFKLNDTALKLANQSLTLQFKTINEDCESMNKRVTRLETAKAFSAGKMWMVMAIFAAVPTILALIALFR